jgi:hypothetical protein
MSETLQANRSLLREPIGEYLMSYAFSRTETRGIISSIGTRPQRCRPAAANYFAGGCIGQLPSKGGQLGIMAS